MKDSDTVDLILFTNSQIPGMRGLSLQNLKWKF